MNESSKQHIGWLIFAMSLALLFMGYLRLASVHENFLTPFSAYATIGYVITAVFFTIMLMRAGLPLNKFGFGARPGIRHLLLALAAIAVLRVYDFGISPLLEQLLDSQRNTERFSYIEGSLSAVVALLIMNWTLAAFGEEFTYRIVLMRGLSFLFDDSRRGQIFAVLIQAVMFGVIHAYQGPMGIAGATFSGLVFGTVTVAARWSIWPAAIAHGTNNTIGIVTIYLG